MFKIGDMVKDITFDIMAKIEYIMESELGNFSYVLLTEDGKHICSKEINLVQA